MSAWGMPGFLLSRLKERWQKYRKAHKRARKKFSEDTVHELRIETRRMLALLDLMHPFCPAEYLDGVERRFKKLFKSSALLRDTQVQIRCLEKEHKTFPELVSFRKWLRRREKRLARRFQNSVKAGVKPKLKASVKALQRWCKGWVEEEAVESSEARKVLLERLNTAYGRLVQLREGVQPNKSSTIHRLRLAFKAYRYMIETLCPEMLRVNTQKLKDLQIYQGMTGEVQDAEILLATLAEYEKEKGKKVASFRAELKERRAKLTQRFLAAPMPCAILTQTPELE